jgi:hypothetical protein
MASEYQRIKVQLARAPIPFRVIWARFFCDRVRFGRGCRKLPKQMATIRTSPDGTVEVTVMKASRFKRAARPNVEGATQRPNRAIRSPHAQAG